MGGAIAVYFGDHVRDPRSKLSKLKSSIAVLFYSQPSCAPRDAHMMALDCTSFPKAWRNIVVFSEKSMLSSKS